MTKINNGNMDLGYLGENYQYLLVKYFIETPKFFIGLVHIIDQNMFTDEHLRRFVGFMKDRYMKDGVSTNYNDLEILIRTKISDKITIEIMLEKLKDLMSREFDINVDLIVENCEKFFKQQNLAKAINKCTEILKNGNASDYYEMEEYIKKALETNTQTEFGFHLFENVEEDLRDDYRSTIPTGLDLLDESLYGGLGKGELGIIVSPMGTGKAQPLYSRVLTINGHKEMGDIVVGDLVIGCDGKPHEVKEIFPQGKRPVYNVRFSNGREVECDENHLWTVKMNNRGKFKVVDFKEILENGVVDDNGKYQYYIPTTKPVEFEKKEIMIDSHLIGEFIGYKHKQSVYGDTSNDEWVIPQEYIINDVEIRLNLLNGLLESNGHLDSDGYLFFPTKSGELLKQIRFIVHSLGCNTANSYFNGVYHLYVKFANDIRPFSTGKEIEGFDYNKHKADDVYMTDVDYVGMTETQCILVDSDEHTYLTEDFIVTHNTSCTTGFSAYAATHKCVENNNKGYRVLHFFFEDVEVNIRRKYYGNLTDIDACDISSPMNKPMAMRLLTDENNEERKLMKRNIIGHRLVSGEVTASDIKRLIQQYISRGFIPDLVIVDYFECLRPEKGNDSFADNEWSREGITMRKLESIANEFNVAIWVPVQSTKSAIGQEYVGLESAGGSVKKTQIGHVIIQLAQTREQKSVGKMNLFIGKLRAAKIGRTEFQNISFNNGTCKFDASDLPTYDNVPF